MTELIEIVEVAPGMFRVKRERGPVARSALPMPYLITDEMPPTEQVDGRYYTSKAKFRAVGRSLGLTEVGNSQVKPRKYRDIAAEQLKKGRREAIGKAIAEYKMGRRPKRQQP